MDEYGDAADQTVDFLYKTMWCRDPKKRRVKPVQRHLLQLDFGGLSDSEDDSDFEVPNEKEGSDDDDGSDQSESESSDDNDSDSESSQDDTHSTGEQNIEPDISVNELLERANASSLDVKKAPSEETRTSSSSSRRIKVLVCCVCLGDISEEDDEIVECDGCGISVHEGCYGIGEAHSVASTESSASTEPWFCDACRAGVRPHCELCPNTGGIYKETDAGRWTHIVCALYIPGVAFGDVDKLSPVTIFEMPTTKWGAKACSLCEDERFSRTGVCISCDAGMCRTYFHVTCAQREGLLWEASRDEEIADPFYAYCKQHTEKSSSRVKRENWLAIRSYMRTHTNHQEQQEAKGRARVQRKLYKHREKYMAAQQKRTPHWVPTEKVPRMLTTCPSAMKNLIRKAELLGINTQVHSSSHKDIRRKWHVAPALSVEFVSYYIDRNDRMGSMKSRLKEFILQKETLQDQERVLRATYDQLNDKVTKLRDINQKKRADGLKLWTAITALSPTKKVIPELIQPTKSSFRSPTKRVARSTPAIIHHCGKCEGSHDQHLLTKCDACHKHFHLGCLDPPLTRMPKKTKLMGWQCSECASSSSEEETKPSDVDKNAPRRLREKVLIREPMKYTPYVKEKKKKRERVVSEGKGRKKMAMTSRKRKLSCDDLPVMPVLPLLSPEDDVKMASLIETFNAQQPKLSVITKQEDFSDKLKSEVGDNPTPKKPVKRKKKSPKQLVKEPDPVHIELDIEDLTDAMSLSKTSPEDSSVPDADDIFTPVQANTRKMRRSREVKDNRTECAMCNLSGINSTLVRCDGCHLCYHFTCLDPPMKKTPKQRGYSWFCSACDQSSDSESQSGHEAEEEFEESSERRTGRKSVPSLYSSFGRVHVQKGTPPPTLKKMEPHSPGSTDVKSFPSSPSSVKSGSVDDVAGVKVKTECMPHKLKRSYSADVDMEMAPGKLRCEKNDTEDIEDDDVLNLSAPVLESSIPTKSDVVDLTRDEDCIDMKPPVLEACVDVRQNKGSKTESARYSEFTVSKATAAVISDKETSSKTTDTENDHKMSKTVTLLKKQQDLLLAQLAKNVHKSPPYSASHDNSYTKPSTATGKPDTTVRVSPDKTKTVNSPQRSASPDKARTPSPSKTTSH